MILLKISNAPTYRIWAVCISRVSFVSPSAWLLSSTPGRQLTVMIQHHIWTLRQKSAHHRYKSSAAAIMSPYWGSLQMRRLLFLTPQSELTAGWWWGHVAAHFVLGVCATLCVLRLIWFPCKSINPLVHPAGACFHHHHHPYPASSSLIPTPACGRGSVRTAVPTESHEDPSLGWVGRVFFKKKIIIIFWNTVAAEACLLGQSALCCVEEE